MTRTAGPHSAVFAALVAAAGVYCYSEAASAAGRATEKMILSPGKKYVLDFSGSPSGGIPSGSFNNFAFGLDLGQSLQKLTVMQDEQRKDVIATHDFAGCSTGQERLLERPLRELLPGNPVWVDYIEVEMLPNQQRDLKWTGGVCYGYRKPSGTWHWNLVPTPLTYDAATDRFRARIWVKEPDITALKLVFDRSVPRQSVRTVTVTVQPPEVGR